MSIAYAKAYLEKNFLPDPEERYLLEESLSELANDLRQIEDPKNRKAAFEEVNFILCRKRDALLEKFGIDKNTGTIYDRIDTLASHSEGSLLLNAFVLVNRGLAKRLSIKAALKDRHFARRNYDEEDLTHVALYGVKKTTEQGFSGGLLVGAMQYDPGNAGHASFSGYVGSVINQTIWAFIKKQKMCREPLLNNNGIQLLDINGIEEEQSTAAIWRQQRGLAVKRALDEISPRQRMVMERHIMGEATEQEIADESGVKRQRIGQIKKRALQKLQHSRTARILRPFETDISPHGRSIS